MKSSLHYWSNGVEVVWILMEPCGEVFLKLLKQRWRGCLDITGATLMKSSLHY